MALSKGMSSDLDQRPCAYEVHWCRIPNVVAPLKELAGDLADACNLQHVSAPFHEFVENFADTWLPCSFLPGKNGRRACCALDLFSKPRTLMAARGPSAKTPAKRSRSLSVVLMQALVLKYLQETGMDALTFRCVSRGCYGLNPALPTMKPIVSHLRMKDVQIAIKFGASAVTFGVALVSGGVGPLPLLFGSCMVAFDGHRRFGRCGFGSSPGEFLFVTSSAPFFFYSAPLYVGWCATEAVVHQMLDPAIGGAAAVEEFFMRCCRPVQAALLTGASPAPFGALPEKNEVASAAVSALSPEIAIDVHSLD